LKRYTTSIGLLALPFAVALMLASCAGAGSSSAEQGSSEEQESGEQGGEESAEGMQGAEDSGVSNSQPKDSFDEERPFDLQFIDQMIVHHQGAIVSSEHMIADSERPELRQLAENIQRSQSEQIEQMRAWRDQWYPDAEPTSEMMDSTQMDEMMDSAQMDGMMGEGHMQEEMMGGDTADSMFLRMMIPHHQSAIDMSEQALERAEHPELRELAQQIIDEQTVEIGLMEGYLKEIEASDGN
jgi:uncharacterized protein (DUF305 family)